ncbi:MAG: hypothetical protein HOK67_16465 [Deltaproteobacteria bacterium]|jgi:hypothetical protein|nr:hypothetical protein [Deltaproteobacteria bacterium]MBT4639006.1 hypothetical protein [Deltaproteobacteria bacterium]MBT6501491.1 hypothetical protein [Deltaproteobacteria bacterium]MBT7153374.1 hypothetical protein [Deltaproteobacteria bacterium]MBT7715741.1 hypothetical protein [Deltaproteobacteria bacterium]
MKTHWITLIALLLFGLSAPVVWADELGDLADDSDNETTQEVSAELSDSDDLSADLDQDVDDMLDGEADEEEADDPGLKISIGGYIKMLGYWNREEYSDQLWGMLQNYPTQPPAQDISGFNNVGTRLQLKLEGYLGNRARLFTAFNINYNAANSIHDGTTAADKSRQNGDVRMVEAFVEIYENSRIWKIGPQLVTWSYLEGMEVPTDRVNARDKSYKSTEYEDTKLPSTGVLLTQNIGDSQLEIMAIPVAKTNIGKEFQDHLFPGTETPRDNTPNQTKWATRFSSTVGKLDYAVSYVEGLDPDTDLNAAGNGRAYNRIKSPGLDLQYSLSSWLAKLSYVQTQTEDEDGDNPLIKNSWQKVAIGGEFTVAVSTINLYAGQHQIADYKTDAAAQRTNFPLGQLRERTDFISGHVNANFLTGNALNLVLMAANHWDEDGETVQTLVRTTFKYKIADGLELLVSPTYMDMMDNRFTDFQTEVKYSF